MKELPLKTVKEMSAGWHPSKYELGVTFQFTDGSYMFVCLPSKMCDRLKADIERCKETFLPWIEPNFQLVGGDNLWQCRQPGCGETIEGIAESGGIVQQMREHLKNKHGVTFV
jgi:hypothetical protein